MKNDAKVFGIGYGRTGTKSLAKAMHLLGYSVKHGIRSPDQIEEFDFTNDIAVTWRYRFLDHVYPNAKFILTVRELNNWLRSSAEHAKHVQNGPLRRLENRFWLYGTCHYDPGVLRESYLRHQQAVEEHFANRRGKLLIMDICAGDGWDVLCPFLGRPKPALTFPHRNKSKPKAGTYFPYWSKRFSVRFRRAARAEGRAHCSSTAAWRGAMEQCICRKCLIVNEIGKCPAWRKIFCL